MRAVWCMIVGAVACGAVELKLPDKVRPLLDMVTAAPPEFGAAALERLLDSGGIDDPPTRRELIERAFQLAGQAHDRWRVRALPGAGATPVMHARAGELRLDQISLEMRAIRLMLALDKERARALFRGLPKPAPPPLTCDDWESPDLGDFYSTLGVIAGQTFTPAEKRKEDDIHLVADYLGAITSPFQFQPALRMVESLDVKADQRRALMVQLGAAIAAVPADDRSFTAVSAALAPDLPRELTASYQRFLASHAGAPPCPVSPAAEKGWEQLAEEKQIAGDEMKLMSPHGGIVSRAERATPEWERGLDDFLSELDGWRQGPDESGASYYHRRMFAYEGLLDVTSGALRARLIDQMVRFALGSELLHDAPAEWFLELTGADQRVRAGNDRGPDVLRGFERSGDPALVLEAALDRLLGSEQTRDR
jgi:hypothetical protein